MKLTMAKEHLERAAAAVASLAERDSLSAFRFVRLDAAGANVSLTGSNGGVQLEWRECADASSSGALAVPGRLFGAFVKALPPGAVEMDCSASRMKLAGSGGVEFGLVAAEAESYVAMPGPKKGCNSMEVEAAVLRELLRKVMFAMSRDCSRPALCGVNVAADGSLLGMTATDGRVLAHVEVVAASRGGKAFEFTLPVGTVGLLHSLLAGADEGCIVKVDASASAVRFTAGSWQLTSKVVDAAFPAWRKVLPTGGLHRAAMEREEFLAALARASVACGEDRAVKVELKHGSAVISAQSDLAKARAEVGTCETDASGTFLFDSRILKDALGAIDDDRFELNFASSHTPVVLGCSVRWKAVVMPMRPLAGGEV